ncbi:unnamed protein product [Staurois parvus]|uniref:Uncharacterized protein n=1 Tax=Staurois parvus TaxID=386267 RepID=A0ABN9CP73_9NEOB|nr:unnamed protein product [Staurois parvus]
MAAFPTVQKQLRWLLDAFGQTPWRRDLLLEYIDNFSQTALWTQSHGKIPQMKFSQLLF